MTDDTGFYDRTFGRSAAEVTAAIRAEAFGEDVGQFSWTTTDELRRFHRRLEIGEGSEVLEVASGSGGPALFCVRSTGCRLVGIDIHEAGVEAANADAARAGLGDEARFVLHDAERPLPFPDESFDAVISIDSMNHVFDRAAVFAEWRRVLRPAGRFLFTDAVVVSGLLRREEIVNRSPAMGEFVFTPEGWYDGALAEAGFADVEVEDVTANIVGVAEKWHSARTALEAEVAASEGAAAHEQFQRFLATVALVAREHRLARYAYSGTKPSPPRASR